ncbi:lipopolysaccharide ABC transporter [Bacteroides pyogenes JCM 6292]|uniref:Thiol peroxidase n=2 Tax=Bacteroides pyogenes TaxID=310300 RepID=W4PFR3_9BACE|nr:lipopolysaccharide ABC transporter [Bacteroides pyogenes JCM 6292]GAE18535.1 electron transfer flavoprotein [Bacteroides pyogenes DSM 20611 = JCM 6294]
MATTNFKGQPVKLIGEFIQVGKVAPNFELVKTDLSSFSLKELSGKNVVLNIFPSLDTGVCAASVRRFNKEAARLKDTVVLAISKDLPFAAARFCAAEGIENVVSLSDFRFSDFDESYGVRMADGPLAGLLARAVVVIGKDGKVAYTELVPEITQEPDYDKAWQPLSEITKDKQKAEMYDRLFYLHFRFFVSRS